MNEWTNIPKVIDGVTPFSAEALNPIITALENRTKFLKEQITTEDIINGVGFTDIGFTGCVKGQFVAYDTITNMYVPASCIWDMGTCLPADQAYVVGLLVSDVIDDQATVLTSGIIRNEVLVNLILNKEKHIPGNYYLKSDGNVTINNTDIAFPIRCGLLTSTGCFVLDIQTPDYRTHNHTHYLLTPSLWSKVENAPNNVTVPTGATRYYNTVNDKPLKTILNSINDSCSLVLNNKVLLSPADYEISDNYIWLKLKYADDVTLQGALFVTHPFMGSKDNIDALAVVEGNSVLKVTQKGNTALLDTEFKVVGNQDISTGKALSSVTSEGLITCDVVNEITGSGGIVVTKTSEGVYNVSAGAGDSQKIELNILNSNGVVFTGSDVLLFKFPKGRTSSIHGTVRIPQTTSEIAKVFMWVQGTGTATPSGTVDIKQLDLSKEKSALIPDRPSTLTLAPLSAVDTNYVYYWETATSFTPIAGGFVNINIEFVNASATVNVCSIGVILK